MAREARNYKKTSFFHIMVQGLNKEYIFKDDVNKRQYIKFMNNAKVDSKIVLISYCIMDNHAHLLVNFENINELSKFMHKVNTTYAIYYNKKYNRVGYVYRDRYKSQLIYSEKQLYACINYIHNNPVKAKICTSANEYKYSSFKIYNENIDLLQKFIKESSIDKNTLEEKNIFLEEKEDKNNEIEQFLEKYMIDKKLVGKELLKDREHLNEIVFLLKKNYNLSIRKISEYINVGRETVRKILKNSDSHNLGG